MASAPHQTYRRSPFRLSLRQLFFVIAILAMAIVSLLYASTVWQIVLGLLVLVVFIAALVGAIVDRRRRQAFAIGMVAAMAVYQAALIRAGIGKDLNTEFVSGKLRRACQRQDCFAIYTPSWLVPGHSTAMAVRVGVLLEWVTGR